MSSPVSSPPSRPQRRSRLVGAIALAAAALALAVLARPTAAGATAAQMRFVQGFTFDPNPPNSVTTTTLIVSGWAPFGCPAVSGAQVTDPEHVAFTVSPAASCGDSAGAAWSVSFDLGLLSEGNHAVDVELTLERPDSGTVVESNTFWFGVVDTSYHEPPPDTTRVVAPLVTWIELDPSQPRTDRDQDLVVHGYFPFDCGVVSSQQVPDPGHLAATFTKGGSCLDTARVYSLRYALGELAAGPHAVDLAITVAGDSVYVAHAGIGFEVIDPNAPPPPPVDSLQSVMSYARPNPFRAATQFSVSVDAPTRVDVVVFDLAGRRVRTVYSGMLGRGTTQLEWDGHRGDGTAAPGGIYFYRLTMPDRVVTRRVVMLSRP